MTSRVPILACLAAASAVLVFAPAQPANAGVHPLNVSGAVKLLPGGGALMRQKGTVSGAPLGSGTLTLKTTLGTGSGATFTFDIVGPRGSVHGTGNVALGFPGTSITYNGTAKITSGTGAFRNLRAGKLKVTGSGQLSGETFKVRLAGNCTY